MDFSYYDYGGGVGDKDSFEEEFNGDVGLVIDAVRNDM